MRRLVGGLRCTPVPVPLLSMLSMMLALLPSIAATSPASHASPIMPLLQSARASCADEDVMSSLQSVGIQPEAAARAAALLELLGFSMAPDLLLLGGGPEAVELFDEIRSRVSLADRAKLRLLVGDADHTQRVASAASLRLDGELTAERNVGCHLPSSILQPHELRKMQESAGGMSTDTIAIVLSVLVGAVGYLVQANTARRAERVLAQQAQEQHVNELAQQKEHEQMVAQIARTMRAVDECCFPVVKGLSQYVTARIRFVAAFAHTVETSQPEAFDEMYARGGYGFKNGLTCGDDGVVSFAGQVVLDPTRPKGLTWSAPTSAISTSMGCSPRVLDVSGQDVVEAVFTSYAARELPEAFFELISANLDGPLANDYRAYIRHQVKPILDVVVDAALGHCAVIQAPPQEWLLEKFPGHSMVDLPHVIVDTLLSYARAFDLVLAEWDAGRQQLLFPANYMMPYGSANQYFEYARKLSEAKRACLFVAPLDPSCVRTIVLTPLPLLPRGYCPSRCHRTRSDWDVSRIEG